jgi:carbon-monoxide dehydrogenase small subunit
MVISAIDLCTHHPKASDAEVRAQLEDICAAARVTRTSSGAVQQGAAAMASA